MTSPKTRRRNLVAAIAASFLGFSFAERVSHADPIVFGTPVTVLTAETDVLNIGVQQYGYALSNTATTVNTVPFTALGANVTLTNFTGGVAPTAFVGSGMSVAGTWTALSANYQNLLKGAAYTTGATTATVTLNNLTVGRNYATQVWASDPRAGSTTTRTETVTGANTVTLDFNTTNALNGLGQSSIGVFQAGATTQSFSMLGNAVSQLNAIQVRDVTNIGFWTGTAGVTWNATGATNFATNYSTDALASADYNTARAVLGTVTFSDTYWNAGAEVAVANNNIILGAGVNAGNFRFQNNTVNYTVTNSTGNILSGTGALVKSGTGTLTLNGAVANTYSGGTTISAGTLIGTLGGALGTGPVTNNATLNLTATSADTTYTFGNVSGNGTINISLGSGTVSAIFGNAWTGYTGTINVGVGQAAGSGKAAFSGALPATATVNVTANSTVFVPSGTHSAPITLLGGNTGESFGQLRLDGTANWAGQVTLNGVMDAADFTIGNQTAGSTSIISGNIIELGGPRHLSKGGVGAITLSGTNNYTGTTTVSVGRLQFGKLLSAYNGNLTTTVANTSVASGATLSVNVGGSGEFSSANVDTLLTGLTSGITTNGLKAGSSFGFDTTNAGGSFTYSTVIPNSTGTGSGAVGINKLGAGTLVLTGANSFTGNTTLTAGTLNLGVAQGVTNGPFGGGAGSLPTGSIVFAGGTLQYSAVNTTDYSSKVATTASPVSIDTNGQSVSFATGFTNTKSGGLTKLGAGTLSLTAANTYTGNTTVSEGTLDVASSGSITNAGVFSASAGGTLSVSGTVNITGAGGLFTQAGTGTGTVTINSGGVINNSGSAAMIIGQNTASHAGILNVSGTYSQTVGSAIFGNNVATVSGTLNINNGGLVTFGTGMTDSSPSGTVNGNGIALGRAGGTGTFNLNAGGTLQTAKNIVRANGTGNFNFNGGTLKALANSSNTGLDVTTTTINAGGAIVDTNGFNFLITDALLAGTGSGGLTKNGSGTLTLNSTAGTSTFTGLTNVTAGRLLYGANDQIGAGAVTVNGATASLNLAGFTDSVGTVTLDGGGSITGGGSSALTSTGSFEMKSGSVNATLSGSGTALNKSTAGTVLLSGNNTYTGSTTIDAGRLVIGSTGSIAAASTLTVNTTGTLVIATDSAPKTNSNVLVLNGGTVIGAQDNIGSGGTIAVDTNGVTHTFTSGGSLVLPESVTMTGGVVVGGGGGGGGSRSGNFYGSGGGGGQVFDLANRSITAGTYTIAVGAGGTGGIGGTSSTAGGIGDTSSISSTSLSATGGNGGANGTTPPNLAGNGGSSPGFSTSSSSGGPFSGGAASGVTAGGGGGAGVAGSGANGGNGFLSSLGSYFGGGGGAGSGSGGTAGLGGGAAGTAGTTSNAGIANTGGGGGSGGGNANGGAGGSGLVVVQYAYNPTAAAATVTLSGAIDLQAASTLDAFGTGGLLIVSGSLGTSTGTGGLTIASSNNAGGVVRFDSSAKTYLGDTTINGGVNAATLQMNFLNALPNGSGKGDVVINGAASGSSATLDLNDFDTAINGLNGTTNTVLGQIVNNNSATTKTLTLGNGDANGNFAGIIRDNTSGTGVIALTKTGSGTQIVSGMNTYTGMTSVIGGKLLINGSNLGTGSTTVDTGATLGGTGSLASILQINNGGTLAPGASIESLASGNLTMSSGSIFAYEAADNSGTGADLMTVGTLSLTNVTLDLSAANLSAGSWLVGDKLTLISYTGSGITSGFIGFTDDTGYSFGANNWVFDYNDSAKGANYSAEATGTQFVTMTLAAVPEPSTLVFGGLALLGFAGVSLRRRRQRG